jgi:KaiC/GvpD/RAD55 family RecA-like ATPase
MLVRAILPVWAADLHPDYPRIVEGDFTDLELKALNLRSYNIHHLPNFPSQYNPDVTVSGEHIDTFDYVFVDMDLKDGIHDTKQSFLEILFSAGIDPTRVVDSGNGIHAYWRVVDLDPMSFLRLQRRLCRKFRTDEAVAKIFQLMRPPGFINTKHEHAPKPVELLFEEDRNYTCEELDRALPPISQNDEQYCHRTFDSTYNPNKVAAIIEDLPGRWYKFAQNKTSEPYRLFYGSVKDRSKADYRLAQLMRADGFSRDEALAVLANTAKASERAPTHRFNYANNIVDKIWDEAERNPIERMGFTVEELLVDADDDHFEGTPFRCNDLFDATECGFRLTHVLGLVGGAGSGKTATSLNYFYHFAKNNPDYVHVVFTLEQPAKEIAKRWRKLAGQNAILNKIVVVVDNYNKNGTFRNLSLDDCESYVRELQETGVKIGCVMIDHIGILKKETKNGEREGLTEICQRMKAFAVNRNVLLIMQSQTSREKAKGGDVELDKDAAFGTTSFEWFVDWLVTIWQPLKRVYDEAPQMTITCFKYCKIRHKSPSDRILEDKVYALKFDPISGLLRRMNQTEKDAFDFYAARASAERNRDKNAQPTGVNDLVWSKHETNENGGNGDVGIPYRSKTTH